MSNITQLKDKDGNNIYPISSDKLILDEQGRSIGERLTDHLENHPKGFSGNYNDLTNKPTIPTKLSQLSNDAGYITNADLDTSQNHVHSNLDVLNGITASKVNEWNNKSTFSGNYNDLINKPTIPSIAGLATESYVRDKVASLVGTAPETLDTLQELSKALGDDPNFATTISNKLGEKASTSYVNAELAKKADSSHTHSNYIQYEVLNGTVVVPTVSILEEE